MKTVARRIAELLLLTSKTNSEIGRMTGLHRDTIRKYRVNLEVQEHSKESIECLGDHELEEALKGRKTRQHRFAEVDFEYVLRELKKPGRDAVQIHREYAEAASNSQDEALKPMSLSKFYTCLREIRKQRSPEFRHDHLPGSSMQFDFSGKRPFFTESDAKPIYAELAVSVLPFSVFTAATVVRTQSLADSVEAFVSSLEYFGGAPNGIVLDNFKAAVSVPRRGSNPAKLNPNFLAAADHYGVFPEPARRYEPRDKGMVENAVLQVQRIFLGQERHLACRSIAELNAALRKAMDELNDRPMKSHGGLSRRELFTRHEQGTLQPLPETRYEFGTWKVDVTLPAHYHIGVEGTEYSAPSRLVGSKVNVKTSATTVEIYSNGKPTALRKRVFDGRPRVTDRTHMPPNHRSMKSYKLEDVTVEAQKLGPTVAAFVQRHIETHKNVKAAGDMLTNIARKMRHSSRERVERAIAEADERGQISAEAVYRILEIAERRHAGLSREPIAKPAAPSGNVRGSDYYNEGEAS